jgi:hypothetical protein
MEILALVIANANDAIQGILDHVQENETGIHVGETYLEWDEIKHLWE